MASSVHQKAKLDAMSQTLDLGSGLKAMLVDSTYADDPTVDFVGDAALAKELAATNYAGTYAGASRKALTTSFNRNDVSGKVELKVSGAVTWAGLGGALNGTIGGVIVYKAITSDAASPVVVFDDCVGNVTTNGGDITWTPNGLVLAEF